MPDLVQASRVAAKRRNQKWPAGFGCHHYLCGGQEQHRVDGAEGGWCPANVGGNASAGTFASYSFTPSGQYSTVDVVFTNDDGGRDLRVDRIEVGGTVYQAEQAQSYDAWGGSGCNPAGGEWLWCSGGKKFTVSTPDNNPPPTGGRTWKILPFGDSNTAGGGWTTDAEKLTAHYSYRGNLYNRLKAAGYTIDYVGTRKAGFFPGSSSTNTQWHGAMTEAIGDVDHGGYGAFAIADNACNFSEFPSGKCNLYDNLNEMLASNPDIILLMIGHNGSGDKPAQFEALINRIKSLKPNAKIFTGGYPGLKNSTGSWQEIRNKAQSLANASTTDNVFYVDLNNALPDSDDFISADNVHHSKKGAEKISSRIYTVLEPYLRNNP
jgi:GDSL-like Lipase/Acylhydrolase family